MESVLAVERPARPPRATVRVPASKSVANRELVLSALAAGTSRVGLGALDPGEDVRRMIAALRALEFSVEDTGDAVVVRGEEGAIPAQRGRVDAGDAGTVARFGAALLALGDGPYVLDGSRRMRERPMAPLARALRALGASVDGDALPLTISGPAGGGEIDLAVDVSSQFASALLVAAPLFEEGLVLRLIGVAVSAPFIDLTIARMRERGIEAKRSAAEIAVVPGTYHARDLEIEGDATAASYFLAAAAITGGEVRVENVDATTEQGDLGVVEHLRAMGCEIDTRGAVTVRGPERLAALDADLSDISDTFPTLAVCCAFADGESRLTGLAHTRVQESDRIHVVATELRRLGADVDEVPDGVRIRPRPLHGAVVRTHRDHRIAMAFALAGLRIEGVAIADPNCVGKTFPDYFALLSSLARSS
ncbi:MAG: 3-phosphoshikimate 1-carboxyvinyltransferase [Chloroflexi bacterium 13_1_40CM_4_68_4]|nr:MAG: 3-phosphoshikimate 1-carboxyvinyltransferase [Chloroflexi bacterium 13_1_40CM_4_68_4]